MSGAPRPPFPLGDHLVADAYALRQSKLRHPAPLPQRPDQGACFHLVHIRPSLSRLFYPTFCRAGNERSVEKPFFCKYNSSRRAPQGSLLA